MVTATASMILLVGLAVDLGGQVYQKQRAQDVASEAARAGGQQLQAGAAVRGQGAIADPARAAAAARAYLAGTTDVTGSARVAGTVITVDTQSRYQTKFLGIIGVQTLPVSGHAEVQITRAVGGVAR
jgi:Flp pilus assembly protein TadG